MIVISPPKASEAPEVSPEQPGALQPGREEEPTEVLFPEAKRRERRRRLFMFAVIVVVLGGTAIGVAATRTNNVARAPQRTNTVPPQRTPYVLGPIVTPKSPEALAVGPNGNLYVSDAGRDQVLERFPSGRFRVVAGDGRSGFSGDGGPALAAELRLGGAGLAFSRDGTLYIADSGNDRVRAVSPHGVITTVLGDGASPRPQVSTLRFAPTPARRFALGSPRALSVAPDGDLYVAATDIVRLGPDGLVSWVAGGKNTPPPGYGPFESEFGNSTGVVVDGRGNVFVVNPTSFGVAEIATSGALVNFGRNVGFGVPDQAAITTTPNGEVVIAGLNGLFKITPSGRVLTIGTPPRLGRGIGFVPFGVAVSGSGVVYEDTNPMPQWTYRSAIVSVTRGAKGGVLWSSSQ
jgi:sugar lactone lactonase YvrE